MYIAFQPKPGVLGLITHAQNEEAIPIDRRNIFSDLYDLDGETTSRVYVRDEPLFREFYAICTEVADRCQLGAEAFDVAVTETIEAFELLLKSAIALPANIEIGLAGELLILESLLNVKGPVAIDAWRGADRDKHDFRIDNQEIEVKSTTGNKRQHWIHGLTQLTESENCQLDLISIHLARTAGEGALSLKRLVGNILAALKDSPSAADRFREGLQKVVTDEQLELAEGQFNFRDEVLGFKVDGNFPRLSANSLKATMGDSSSHVADVSYLLNLDDLAASGSSALAGDIIANIRDSNA
jgi:hypothetical protein